MSLLGESLGIIHVAPSDRGFLRAAAEWLAGWPPEVEAYGWADFVICRAGALTVAELAAVGLGALFVPFPAAVDDHQTVNASGLAEAGAAVIVAEHELTAGKLAGLLGEWCDDRAALVARAERARTRAMPAALEDITGACLALAGDAS